MTLKDDPEAMAALLKLQELGYNADEVRDGLLTLDTESAGDVE